MAKLQSFMLRNFQEELKDIDSIKVPINSIFVKCITIPQGIIAIYEVPDDKAETETENFKILNNNEEIPKKATFIDIISFMTENEDKEQGMVLLPIYKL